MCIIPAFVYAGFSGLVIFYFLTTEILSTTKKLNKE